MVSVNRSQKLWLVKQQPAHTAPTSDAEERLISALEQGEPVEPGVLYDHLIGVIEATLFRVLGRRSPDHDDLLQNAFEQIVITLRKKRFAKACSLRSWAAAITTNVALNSLRANRTQNKYFDSAASQEVQALQPSEQSPEHDAQVQRDLATLRELLAELPIEQARTLLLHDAFGYELSEISVLMKASVAAAQSRLVRGRKKLRQRLIECGVKVREPT